MQLGQSTITAFVERFRATLEAANAELGQGGTPAAGNAVNIALGGVTVAHQAVEAFRRVEDKIDPD